MKTLQVINFIDAIIEASLIITIPLLLSARNFDASEIGLVLAVSSLAFLVFRMLFASLSDLIGLKKFFVLNSLSNVISTITYLFASTSFAYSSGKVFEGVSSASIWAVNRTAVRQKSKERDPSIDTARINAIRIMSYFVATVAIGYVLQFVSFEGALLALTVIGLTNLTFTFSLREEPSVRVRPNLRKILAQLDIRKKPRIFLTSSVVMSFAVFSGAPLFRLVLPLFLQSQGFDYAEIGVLMAFQWLLRGLSVFSAVRRLSSRQVVLFGTLLLSASLIALLFAPPAFSPLLIIMLGAGMGSVEIMWEKIISHTVRGSKSLGSDIAIIHTLPSLASVIALGAGGFAITHFGFAPAFLIAALFYFLYLTMGLKVLDSAYPVPVLKGNRTRQ